jgi:hypothetical protein
MTIAAVGVSLPLIAGVKRHEGNKLSLRIGAPADRTLPGFCRRTRSEEIETYHQVIQRLAPRVTGYLEDVPHGTLKQFCDLLNLMADAGGEKENAISTCLLEHASQLRVRKIIRPYLGAVARRELR